MMSESPGLVEALEPVAKALQSMEVRFYVGGSVASSYHGASRSTLDVDLVADNNSALIDFLMKHLVMKSPLLDSHYQPHPNRKDRLKWFISEPLNLQFSSAS